MEENVELKNFTTFKIGGKARYFFRVKNAGEAGEALRFARKENLPFFVIGGGSNLLASDEGFSGVVIKNEILGVSFAEESDYVEVTAGAGEPWDAFVGNVVSRGLYGLENLSGIPGTVGASPVQNIGAYGAEAKDCIVSVETVDVVTGAVKIFSADECKFGYRDSFFKTADGKRYIITRVCFRFKKQGLPNIGYKDLKNYFTQASKINSGPSLAEIRQAVLEIRLGKFPDLKTAGTAGSFFKNPIIPKTQFDELKKKYPNLPGFPTNADRRRPDADLRRQKTPDSILYIKVPLAWILDNVCKLKGFHTENVGLFERQPIVIVNTGNASAEGVKKFAKEVSECVKEKTGITVEWEVDFLK